MIKIWIFEAYAERNPICSAHDTLFVSSPPSLLECCTMSMKQASVDLYVIPRPLFYWLQYLQKYLGSYKFLRHLEFMCWKETLGRFTALCLAQSSLEIFISEHISANVMRLSIPKPSPDTSSEALPASMRIKASDNAISGYGFRSWHYITAQCYVTSSLLSVLHIWSCVHSFPPPFIFFLTLASLSTLYSFTPPHPLFL